MNKKPAFVVRSPAQGLKVINHPDIVANFDKALKRAPKHKVAVLVPCAATKPFPDAPSHKSGYLAALAGKKVDKHVVSEPLGVVPYEWSRKYPNDSYDFPPEYLKGSPFDALAKRIGKWFDVVGKKYDRIYCALPAHHSRLVKAALKGKKTSHITWVGQRQCLDTNVCATGEYRATTHSYRGFLKKNVRGAANRGHASRGGGRAASIDTDRLEEVLNAPEAGLWRVDATGRTTGGNTYALRWYEPGSRLTGRLARRRFQLIYKTSSLRVWWLRVLADVGNELRLRPDQVDVGGLRALARRGWSKTPVSAPDAVRIQGLREHYRAHYSSGKIGGFTDQGRVWAVQDAAPRPPKIAVAEWHMAAREPHLHSYVHVDALYVEAHGVRRHVAYWMPLEGPVSKGPCAWIPTKKLRRLLGERMSTPPQPLSEAAVEAAVARFRQRWGDGPTGLERVKLHADVRIGRAAMGRGNALEPLPDTALDLLVLVNTVRGNPRAPIRDSEKSFARPTRDEVTRSIQRLRLGRMITRRRGVYQVTEAGLLLLKRTMPKFFEGANAPAGEPPPAPKPKRHLTFIRGGRKNRRG